MFIRDVWVECCDHLSMFNISNRDYYDNRCEDSHGYNEMNYKIADVLDVGDTFHYEYDFGSTTEIELEVVKEFEVSTSHSQIEIIARNDPFKKTKRTYLNSPRDGICGYEGNSDNEKPYMPFNNYEYELDESEIYVYEEVVGDFDKFYSMCEEKEKKYPYSNYAEFLNGRYCFDLVPALNVLTKKRLVSIAENLSIDVSKDLRKDKYTEAFLLKYENGLINTMPLLDNASYKVLKECIRNDGKMEFNEKIVGYQFQLAKLGMLYQCRDYGTAVFIIQNEVKKILKDNDSADIEKITKYNTKIIKCFKGIMNVYGVLDIDNLVMLLEKYLNNKINDSSKLVKLLKINADSNEIFYTVNDENDKLIFVNINIDDYKEIYNKIDENYDYKILPMKELIDRGSKDYYKKSEIGKLLMKAFKKAYKGSKMMFGNFVTAVSIAIQIEEPEVMIKMIIDKFGNNAIELHQPKQKADIDEFEKYLRDFCETVSIWKYKGKNKNMTKCE